MSQRVTIADVAREAEVSQQTVSRAINDKGEISASTRQRVLEVIERLGYRPSGIARGLVTHRTLTIGLVVPDIANPFFAEIARGAEEAAHTAGYSLFLCNTIEDPRREADVLRTLEGQRVDGIVLCSSRLSDDRLTELAACYPAMVLVNRKLAQDQAAVSTVRVDDASGARLAVRHLHGSGRRAVAFLAGPPSSQSGRERARGYAAALTEAGLLPDPALSVSCSPYFEGGREAARVLLVARPDVDAFLCYNDLVAVGALQACSALGRRVPEDVAIVGCDDIPLAGLVTPPLTTLRVDQRSIGTAAVELLLERINGRAPDRGEIVLQPELVIRASAPAGYSMIEP
jgi:LacI family transcriptional regulator